MTSKLTIYNDLQDLLHDPSQILEGSLNGHAYQASIGIQNYIEKIQDHYQNITGSSLQNYCQQVSIQLPINNFGLIIEFKDQIKLALHNLEMMLEGEVQEILKVFGPLILRNVIIENVGEENEHKAIFSDLNFHRDRGLGQARQYSLYYRNPIDPEQTLPRKSSTVFVANIVAYLQHIAEQDNSSQLPIDSHYDLFKPIYKITENAIEKLPDSFPNTIIDKLTSNKQSHAFMTTPFINMLNNILGISNVEKYKPILLKTFLKHHDDIAKQLNQTIFEQKWSAKKNQGEVAIIHNPEIFHASYYREGRGYRIRVRYLYP